MRSLVSCCYWPEPLLTELELDAESDAPDAALDASPAPDVADELASDGAAAA